MEKKYLWIYLIAVLLFISGISSVIVRISYLSNSNPSILIATIIGMILSLLIISTAVGLFLKKEIGRKATIFVGVFYTIEALKPLIISNWYMKLFYLVIIGIYILIIIYLSKQKVRALFQKKKLSK